MQKVEKRDDVVVVNEIEKKKKKKKNQMCLFRTKIYCIRDLDFNILVFQIELKDWNQM